METYDIDSIDNRNADTLRAFSRRIGPALERYFRPVVRGVERIPEGAALYVGNHNGATLSPDTLPTRIHQEVQEPIHFPRSGTDAAGDELYILECDARVRAAMQSALTRL